MFYDIARVLSIINSKQRWKNPSFLPGHDFRHAGLTRNGTGAGSLWPCSCITPALRMAKVVLHRLEVAFAPALAVIRLAGRDVAVAKCKTRAMWSALELNFDLGIRICRGEFRSAPRLPDAPAGSTFRFLPLM